MSAAEQREIDERIWRLAVLESSLSWVARKYRVGTTIELRLAEVLTRIAAPARNWSTAGFTVSKASCSDASSCGVAQRPRSSHDKNEGGKARTGAKRVIAATGLSSGTGDLAKVVERTSATRFGGGFAAIESAIGPENDSPKMTSGVAGGSEALTRVSSSE